MKLDTSTYYPKSPLDDDDSEEIRKNSGSEDAPAADVAKNAAQRDVSSEDANASEGVDSTVKVEIVPEENGDSEIVIEPGPANTPVEKFVTKMANILSWVLVPLLMPVYGALLAFGLSVLHFTAPGVRLAFVLIIAAFNLLIPAIIVFLLKRFGFVHDIGLNGRKERFWPYAVCVICLAGTAVFMWSKHAPMWFVMFYAGGAVAGLVEMLVNTWWKISVHTAGAAGIVALLLQIMLSDFPTPSAFGWFVAAVALTGLLGSARIWLGRHTVSQVFAGYAVGFSAVYFMMMIQ